MVLVERNSENVRNGRRSRGPSPNGQQQQQQQPGGTPDTSSDDDSTKKIGKSSKAKSEYEEKIRVGRDYQVQCPDFVPIVDRKVDTLADRALLVWSPTKDIPESKLEDYINVAKEKYGYNGEQALGMLFWHKHDLERAVLDLANFTPFPDEWSVEDKVLFEQAFQFHGKSFHRIRQMLPDKTIASLVKYYYSWKKTRSRTSVMDRQEKIKTKEGSENGSENGSNEESDSEEKKWSLHRGICRASNGSPTILVSMADENTSSANSVFGPTTQTATAGNMTPGLPHNKSDHHHHKVSIEGTKQAPTTNTCNSCGVVCIVMNTSPHGGLCTSCFHHWRRTGSLRPTSGPSSAKRNRSLSVERHKRKPPRGMYINHDDIVAFASNTSKQDDPLSTTDREIVSLLTSVQRNKQKLSLLANKYPENIDSLRPNEAATRINPRWNSEEHQLAMQGIRRFGKDFTAIAEMIGTKTEVHLRTFFVNYRRRLNLDVLLKEFDAKQLLAAKLVRATASGGDGSDEPEVMEVDSSEATAKTTDDDVEEMSIIDESPAAAAPTPDVEMIN